MVRQFDVYANPFSESRPFAPLVVVLSSHLVDLEAVVIAPLFSDRQVVTAAEVSIGFESASYVLSLTDLASTNPARLRRGLGSLIDQEDEIRRGLEKLFNGF